MSSQARASQSAGTPLSENRCLTGPPASGAAAARTARMGHKTNARVNRLDMLVLQIRGGCPKASPQDHNRATGKREGDRERQDVPRSCCALFSVELWTRKTGQGAPAKAGEVQ